MKKSHILELDLKFSALTRETWKDFTQLFGERGACGGCWCMLWRLPRQQFEKQKGTENRRAMEQLVHAGEIPGLLAFHNHEPVGWCAVAPRQTYTALARSRILKPVNTIPCWSVACLFVDKKYRKRGVATALLKAAADYVRNQGGIVLEGYPVAPKQNDIPSAFAWTGIPKAFERAGFHEVARRSPTRPIMRIKL